MENLFADAHIHVSEIPGWHPVAGSPVCSCAHSPLELEAVEIAAHTYPGCVIPACGIHPQKPDVSLLPELETIVRSGRAAAIGEAGFDLYTNEFASNIVLQESVWRAQLDMAVSYGLPLVVHCRRALHLMYPFARQLAKVPVVVFHSFAGSPAEAKGFLKRGVNAYFSLGKQLLNGNKRALACAAELPIGHLLAETDAPFQRLKNEETTSPRDIIRVYGMLASLRGVSTEDLAVAVAGNFCNAFMQR